ncbi:tyrosine-type recombinase/integrase [Pasteurella skyensis]|uniref:Tyrosine-type recombinase/integrase n=1 Tax=Phocoenobacter skyensis TaxID=97481 RepID=A0AAJ6NB94_9PAST|nr:tyrosine-type recombinase/integrase [Pasteurella skyensis]MDP8173649.1 tyrosine-type recombinase/integrase [Pasteurella skyensis]MDP8178017.1 tyrosine-type recombinase/integrase [Pasteurella skyensis]
MGVRKDNSRGKWIAEAYQDGKRVRRWFATKGEANRFFNAIKQQNNPIFQAITSSLPEAPKRLSEMADLWYDLHGVSLVGGEATLTRLKNISHFLGDPYYPDLAVGMFAEFRKKRLSGEIRFPHSANLGDRDLSISSVNLDLSQFKAMINELIRLDIWKGDNPLKKLRPFKKKEGVIHFLQVDEIKRLICACDSISSDLSLIVKLCLATGARWSEIQQLKGSQVIEYKLTFTKTKSGKNRSVPISPELYKLIPKKQGRLFSDCYRKFNTALKKANITLPNGQLTHVLRHSFASHFMMNGGNILVLKEILGHSDIKMTMRYAHFSPSYLETAVELNPLKNLQN